MVGRAQPRAGTGEPMNGEIAARTSEVDIDGDSRTSPANVVSPDRLSERQYHEAMARKQASLFGLYQVHGQRFSEHTDISGGKWKGSQQLPTFFVDAASHEDAANRAKDMVHGGSITTMHKDTGEVRSHDVEPISAREYWGVDVPEDSTDW